MGKRRLVEQTIDPKGPILKTNNVTTMMFPIKHFASPGTHYGHKANE